MTIADRHSFQSLASQTHKSRSGLGQPNPSVARSLEHLELVSQGENLDV
jgi:hypothetical protein